MKPNARLKHAREARGWSQAKIAEMIGVETPTVSRWERGVSFPYPYYREKLCELFGKDAEELGLVPEDEQKVADTEGRTHSLVSAVPPRICDPTMPVPTAHNPGLVGREELLLQLKRSLCAQDQSATVALYGLPGVGKTTLAAALAADHDVQARFRDGILWAGLGPHPNVIGLLNYWGSLLGISTSEAGKMNNRESWALALRSTIGLRQLLLVIDDPWDLEMALTFRVGGPNCAYLLTTRMPHIAVSFAHRGAIQLPELHEEDGIELLSRYAAEAVEQEPETARALVHSVGALPLALGLMGKYLRVQAASGQPRRLRSAMEQLRDVERRLRLGKPVAFENYFTSLPFGTPLSLASMIEVSTQQLTQQARTVLQALSILPAKPSSFSEEAALAISHAPAEVLDTLSDAGLLETSSPGRYTLHQTIADYARSQLTSNEPYEHLIAYAARYIEEHITDYDVLDPESRMVLTAIEAAYALDRKANLIWLVSTIAPFLQLRRLYLPAEQYLHWAYEAATALHDLRGLTNILLHLGKVAQKQGNFGQAEEYFREGLALARQLNEREQACSLLQHLGLIANEQKRYDEALEYFREGLALARQLNDREQICSHLQYLGVVAAKRGAYTESKSYLREGLALARQLNDREQVGSFLQNLGMLSNLQECWSNAHSYLHEGLALARQLGHRELVSSIVSTLGWLATKQGAYTQAYAYLQEGLVLTQQLGHRERLCTLLQNLGAVADQLGRANEARAYLQEGLDLARQSGYSEQTAILLTTLSWMASKQENYIEAEVYLRESLTIARRTGRPELLGPILNEWGELKLKQRQPEAAAAAFREMYENLTEEQQDFALVAQYGLERSLGNQGSEPLMFPHAQPQPR